jgi:hypothetical protein
MLTHAIKYGQQIMLNKSPLRSNDADSQDTSFDAMLEPSQTDPGMPIPVTLQQFLEQQKNS